MDEAEALLSKVVSRQEQLLGPDHYDVLTSQYNLFILMAMQEDPRARPKLEALLETRDRLFGPEHPDGLKILEALTEICFEAGDDDAALSYGLRALRVSRRLLGDAHPRSHSTAWHILALYDRLGLDEEAGALRASWGGAPLSERHAPEAAGARGD